MTILVRPNRIVPSHREKPHLYRVSTVVDAFNLGGVQRIDLPPALVLTLMAHAEGE
jgi:hypothetical protein